jgi:hypothetical protein
MGDLSFAQLSGIKFTEGHRSDQRTVWRLGCHPRLACGLTDDKALMEALRLLSTLPGLPLGPGNCSLRADERAQETWTNALSLLRAVKATLRNAQPLGPPLDRGPSFFGSKRSGSHNECRPGYWPDRCCRQARASVV